MLLYLTSGAMTALVQRDNKGAGRRLEKLRISSDSSRKRLSNPPGMVYTYMTKGAYLQPITFLCTQMRFS
jgi:hypothetical protein